MVVKGKGRKERKKEGVGGSVRGVEERGGWSGAMRSITAPD